MDVISVNKEISPTQNQMKNFPRKQFLEKYTRKRWQKANATSN